MCADTAWMPTFSRPPLVTLLAGLLAFAAALVWLTGLTGDSGTNLLIPFLSDAWANGSVAVLWWAGAIGFGLPLVRWAEAAKREAYPHDASRDHTSADTIALAIPVGLAAMLALDALIGTLGGLMVARGLLAWALPAVGVFAGIRTLRQAPLVLTHARTERTPFLIRVAFIGMYAVLAALLLVAATAAPGWLWSSEFGGYDAQSYHLPLAIAWTQPGSSVWPVEGNVYSALPSFVEAAFAHLIVLRGDQISAAIACQWWAAIATLLGAFVVARLARHILGEATDSPDNSTSALVSPTIVWVASIAFLATPWIVVVGTLAYNDIVPVVALAGGWLLVVSARRVSGRTAAREEPSPRTLDWRSITLLALIVASATGAKPTAFFFTALPLAVIALIEVSPRVVRHVPLAAAVGLIVLAPWLVRNWLTYENPVFPFASGIFGLGPWSAEQHAIFASAHSPDRPFVERLPLLWSEWAGYGFASRVDGAAELFPQWSGLPILGLIGLIALAVRRENSHAQTSNSQASNSGASNTARAARAGLAAIATVLIAWLLLTHLKSRFLITTAVPLSIGVAGFVAFAARLFSRRSDSSREDAVPATLAVMVAGLLAIAPIANYLREPAKNVGSNGERLRAPSLSIGSIPVQTGEAVARLLADADAKGDTATRNAILQQVASPFAVNYLLPPDARIVGIGFSTPFYMRRPITATTVWDRGPVDIVAERAPDAPATWGSLLRQRGFTHALIDPTMLQNWAAKGWLNPQLAQADWVEPFGASNRLIARTVDGKVLFELAP